jgi:predicted SAM-dependent methyltransferase
MITRLHLGASRLEKLVQKQLDVFLDKSWLHLGEEQLENPNNRPLIDVDYSKTNFVPFYFRKGDKLNFKNNQYDFIFSEHFFEHLYLDEAIDLFSECNRILKPNCVMRIVVPDADLRPIPEKVGFPGDQYGWNHPRKHKTRWSIYSLSSALNITGFEVLPIKNYFSDGTLKDLTENLPLDEYSKISDKKMFLYMNYIKRTNSLIVDAIKR